MRRFTIHTPQRQLDDLHRRLLEARLPHNLDGTDGVIGPSTEYMSELIRYWRDDYDWRSYESTLNELPHHVTDIGGIDIHFIHVPSPNPAAQPLLLVHGWPDSFYRFVRLIPILTDTFTVVAPSIPGFGYSTPIAQTHTTTADMFATLMTDHLGYQRFAVHGGDIGGYIVRAMTQRHPEAITAAHLTDAGYPTGDENPDTLSDAERAFVAATHGWLATEGAYLHLQRTKPATIAYSLLDSPTGLAAWIVSMIASQAGDDPPDYAFGGRDHLLTNIMIYWLTGTAGSAAHTYHRLAGALAAPTTAPNSTVPTGLTLFPRELQPPREWAERTLDLRSYETMPQGGHFAALEEPHLLADALKRFLTSPDNP